MEQVVTAPNGRQYVVRAVRSGDFGDLGVMNDYGEMVVATVSAVARVVHHGKWRVTAWPWPTKPSFHRAFVSELADGEEAAKARAVEVAALIEQGVLAPDG